MFNPTYNGGPNRSEEEKKQARRSCGLCCCFVVLVLGNDVISFLLGGFNLANTYNIGAITSSQTASGVSSRDQETLQQLMVEMDNLRGNLSLYNDIHEGNDLAVKTRLGELEEMIAAFISRTTGTPSPTTSTANKTTPPDAVATMGATSAPSVEPPSGTPVSLLYENCSLMVLAECPTNSIQDDTSHQVFQFCATSKATPNPGAGMSLTDMFCAIDNTQVLPVTSSLRYHSASGSWSCVCHGVSITHAVETDGLSGFNCRLYFKYCPSAITIPRN